MWKESSSHEKSFFLQEKLLKWDIAPQNKNQYSCKRGWHTYQPRLQESQSETKSSKLHEKLNQILRVKPKINIPAGEVVKMTTSPAGF